MAHSLTNAKKESFIARSSQYSTHGSRRGINLLGWEEGENLSIEQERRSLNSALGRLNEIIVECNKDRRKHKELRREIINRKIEIQARLSEINAKYGHLKATSKDFPHLLIDTFKKHLDADEYNRIFQIARDRYDKESSVREKMKE